jgi:BirA family biotin operon repressor/biotin-[acetyl-CoA-carboxylase] ligase
MTSLDQAWQAAADPRRRIGHAVEFHATIGSTNDRARAALTEPGGDGLAVVADLQTAGRGRQGRTWVSPAGRNLAVSIGFVPHLAVERIGLLGLAVAVAVRDACAAAVDAPPPGIRWPNDIVASDGLKLAGLLVETSLAGTRVAEAVIGVGINVNWRRHEMPLEIAARATSLAELAGADLDRPSLLRHLLDRVDAEVAALEGGGTPVDRFRAASVLDGRWVTVDLGAEQVEGRVLGIGEGGELRIEAERGVRELGIGEVIWVRDAAAVEVAR